MSSCERLSRKYIRAALTRSSRERGVVRATGCVLTNAQGMHDRADRGTSGYPVACQERAFMCTDVSVTMRGRRRRAGVDHTPEVRGGGLDTCGVPNTRRPGQRGCTAAATAAPPLPHPHRGQRAHSAAPTAPPPRRAAPTDGGPDHLEHHPQHACEHDMYRGARHGRSRLPRDPPGAGEATVRGRIRDDRAGDRRVRLPGPGAAARGRPPPRPAARPDPLGHPVRLRARPRCSTTPQPPPTCCCAPAIPPRPAHSDTPSADHPAGAEGPPRTGGIRPTGEMAGAGGAGQGPWAHLMVQTMRDQDRPGTDLRALLELVEAAPPTDAIEVVADELAAVLGAHAVTS